MTTSRIETFSDEIRVTDDGLYSVTDTFSACGIKDPYKVLKALLKSNPDLKGLSQPCTFPSSGFRPSTGATPDHLVKLLLHLPLFKSEILGLKLAQICLQGFQMKKEEFMKGDFIGSDGFHIPFFHSIWDGVNELRIDCPLQGDRETRGKASKLIDDIDFQFNFRLSTDKPREVMAALESLLKSAHIKGSTYKFTLLKLAMRNPKTPHTERISQLFPEQYKKAVENPSLINFGVELGVFKHF
jgi:hypothetical protein